MTTTKITWFLVAIVAFLQAWTSNLPVLEGICLSVITIMLSGLLSLFCINLGPYCPMAGVLTGYALGFVLIGDIPLASAFWTLVMGILIGLLVFIESMKDVAQASGATRFASYSGLGTLSAITFCSTTDPAQRPCRIAHRIAHRRNIEDGSSSASRVTTIGIEDLPHMPAVLDLLRANNFSNRDLLVLPINRCAKTAIREFAQSKPKYKHPVVGETTINVYANGQYAETAQGYADLLTTLCFYCPWTLVIVCQGEQDAEFLKLCDKLRFDDEFRLVILPDGK